MDVVVVFKDCMGDDAVAASKAITSATLDAIKKSFKIVFLWMRNPWLCGEYWGSSCCFGCRDRKRGIQKVSKTETLLLDSRAGINSSLGFSSFGNCSRCSVCSMGTKAADEKNHNSHQSIFG